MSLEAQRRVAEACDVFSLTPAELAILCLAAEGHDNAAIAQLRGVLASTVKKQAGDIAKKVGARSLARAAVVVLRLALVKACECTVDLEGAAG